VSGHYNTTAGGRKPDAEGFVSRTWEAER
jgi:hypothetical protein